jgi:hypothetical protein
MAKKSTYKIAFGISFCCALFLTNLSGQKATIGIVDLDSTYIQVGFLEKNDSLLQRFKRKFEEKENLMIVAFQKKAEDFYKFSQYTENWKEVEIRRNLLAKEQQGIQKFEKSLENATHFLEKELKIWSVDYIKKEIKFVFYTQGYKTILIKQEIIITTETLENITQLMIDAIKNNNQWASAHEDFVKFILSKTIFDFQLD